MLYKNDKKVADYLDKLQPKQLDYILWCIRDQTQMQFNVARNTLPFMSVSLVQTHLRIALNKAERSKTEFGEKKARFILRILSIIDPSTGR